MFHQNYSWEEGREGKGRERGEPETQELEWRHRAEKGDRDRGERGKETETRKITRGKRGERQEKVEKGGERRGEGRGTGEMRGVSVSNPLPGASSQDTLVWPVDRNEAGH